MNGIEAERILRSHQEQADADLRELHSLINTTQHEAPIGERPVFSVAQERALAALRIKLGETLASDDTLD